MNIYIEFKKLSLRIRIKTEEMEVQVPPNFYFSITGTESFYMFRDDENNNRIKHFIERHRNSLGVFGKIRHWLFRNTVFSLVDKEVHDLVTIIQLGGYCELFLDARVNWIVKKPDMFDSTNLENIEKIKHTYINRGRTKVDVVLSRIESRH